MRSSRFRQGSTESDEVLIVERAIGFVNGRGCLGLQIGDALAIGHDAAPERYACLPAHAGPLRGIIPQRRPAGDTMGW